MHRTLGMVALTLVIGLLASPATALAEDSEKASELNRKAIASYQAKAYLKAIDFWLQATEFADDVQLIKLHKNLGLAMRKLERPAEAWYHLTTYMKRSPETDGKVAKTILELEEDLKKVHTKVFISTQPAGAMAILPPGDRMHRVKTPFQWWLPPGEFVVEFQKEGYETLRKKMRIEYGGNAQFDYILAQQKRTGTLKLNGDADGSSVRINGKSQGPLPYHADLKPGEYTIEVYYADGRVWKTKAMVIAGKTTELGVQLATIKLPGGEVKQPKQKSHAWKWALIGTGAGVAAVGGVLQMVAFAKSQEINSDWDDALAVLKQDPNALEWKGAVYPSSGAMYNAVVVDAYDEKVDPLYTSAFVLYGVGGAVAVAGIVGLLIDQGSDDGKSAVSLQPSIGPGQAGFDFQLTF